MCVGLLARAEGKGGCPGSEPAPTVPCVCPLPFFFFTPFTFPTSLLPFSPLTLSPLISAFLLYPHNSLFSSPLFSSMFDFTHRLHVLSHTPFLTPRSELPPLSFPLFPSSPSVPPTHSNMAAVKTKDHKDNHLHSQCSSSSTV